MKTSNLASRNSSENSSAGIGLVADVNLTLRVRLGRVAMCLGDALKLAPGSVLDIQGADDERVDLVVGGKVIARGMLFDAAGNYAVRIDSISASSGDID